MASIAVSLLPQIERGPPETTTSTPKAESVTEKPKGPADGPTYATLQAPLSYSPMSPSPPMCKRLVKLIVISDFVS